jgi:hypothetical protein
MDADWHLQLPFAKLGRSGTPGTVLLFGEKTHPSLTTPDGDCVVGTAIYGSGRAVAIAHEGYISNARHLESGSELLLSVIRWAAGKDLPLSSPICVACVGHDVAWLQNCFEKAKLDDKCKAVAPFASECHVIIWIGETGSGDVVDRSADITTTFFGQLLPYVEHGGGLIVAMCPWGFEQVCILVRPLPHSSDYWQRGHGGERAEPRAVALWDGFHKRIRKRFWCI